MSFIKQANFITTGFVGTPYLLDALTEIGRLDKAYTLLLREEYPSWLYSVNQGATTIWEHWDGLREDGYVRYNFTVPEGTVKLRSAKRSRSLEQENIRNVQNKA